MWLFTLRPDPWNQNLQRRPRSASGGFWRFLSEPGDAEVPEGRCPVCSLLMGSSSCWPRAHVPPSLSGIRQCGCIPPLRCLDVLEQCEFPRGSEKAHTAGYHSPPPGKAVLPAPLALEPFVESVRNTQHRPSRPPAEVLEP